MPNGDSLSLEFWLHQVVFLSSLVVVPSNKIKLHSEVLVQD